MNRDLYNNTKVAQSIVPQNITAAANGTGVDTQGWESAVFVLDVGTIGGSATPTVTFKFQDSDDNSTFADIAAKDLIGEATATAGDPLDIVAANDAGVHRRGYIGPKRYVRIICSAVSGTSPALLTCGNVVLGNPRHVS